MAESNPKSRLKAQIDENLKRIYDDALNEEIPDRLTGLLERLRQRSLDPASPDSADDASSRTGENGLDSS